MSRSIPFPSHCPVHDAHIPNEQLSQDLLKSEQGKGYKRFSSTEGLFSDLNDNQLWELEELRLEATGTHSDLFKR